MTSRNREGTLAVSEEFTDQGFPGSFPFSHPLDINQWCQSIPSGPELPLTPPASDCALSDLEMNTQWSQSSLPEETWYTGPAQDNSIYVQSSSTAWDGRTLYASQDLQPLGSGIWTNLAPGPVDLSGLSPALSYESQSTHTLNALSESDVSILPPSLDLSFASEPVWSQIGPYEYQRPPVSQQPLPGNAFVPSPDESATRPNTDSVLPQWPVAHGAYHVPVQPMFFPVDGRGALPFVPQPVIAHGRTLLPRTKAQATATSQAQPLAALQRPIRPLIQGRVSSRNSAHSVSSSSGAVSHAQGSSMGQRVAPSQIMPAMTRSATAPAADPVQPIPRTDLLVRDRSAGALPIVMDPAAEDFNAFIQYDQVEQPQIIGPSSFPGDFTPLYSVPSTHSPLEDSPALLGSKLDRDTKPARISSAATSVVSNELDEGRHRNHVLYSKGAEPDGLFHCPFRAQENCPHRPTKLKCNYDKYIDSHLKPFRCKSEACAKQEFSSTACLLRHEREAHGMHGHGDRPHLCFYTGCERGFAGNGFPRRYNLYDHMKRVHDHKEEPQSTIGSPDTAQDEPTGQRKPVSRKRKAPSSTTSEPTAQRPKLSTQESFRQQVPAQAMPFPRQEYQPILAQASRSIQVQPVPRGPVYYQGPVMSSGHVAPPHMPHPVDDSRQRFYSEWANQKELLARQLDFVQPGDEAGMERFSRDAMEFRRLSGEAHQR